jgi:hypothetical protein
MAVAGTQHTSQPSVLFAQRPVHPPFQFLPQSLQLADQAEEPGREIRGPNTGSDLSSRSSHPGERRGQTVAPDPVHGAAAPRRRRGARTSVPAAAAEGGPRGGWDDGGNLRRKAFGQTRRLAATNRRRRSEGRPETFDFLGFTHYCGKTLDRRFMVHRKTQARTPVEALPPVDSLPSSPSAVLRLDPSSCRPSLPPPVFPRRASPPLTYGSGWQDFSGSP